MKVPLLPVVTGPQGQSKRRILHGVESAPGGRWFPAGGRGNGAKYAVVA
jgi:hypothetical protein